MQIYLREYFYLYLQLLYIYKYIISLLSVNSKINNHLKFGLDCNYICRTEEPILSILNHYYRFLDVSLPRVSFSRKVTAKLYYFSNKIYFSCKLHYCFSYLNSLIIHFFPSVL